MYLIVKKTTPPNTPTKPAHLDGKKIFVHVTKSLNAQVNYNEQTCEHSCVFTVYYHIMFNSSQN